MNPALAPAPPPAVNGTVRPAAAAAPPGVPPPKKHKQRMGQRADQDKVARDERGDDTGAADREEKDAKKPGNNKASATTTQYVDHTYTDFAIVGEDDLRLLDENSALLPNPASSMEASTREKLKGMSCTYGPMKKNAGGVVQPFPGKVSAGGFDPAAFAGRGRDLGHGLVRRGRHLGCGLVCLWFLTNHVN